MGTLTKSRPRPDPRGVLYWLSRAVICILFAPLLGILVGILGALAGVWLGELAALAVLALFLADIFMRLVRARRPVFREAGTVGIADPDIDAWS